MVENLLLQRRGRLGMDWIPAGRKTESSALIWRDSALPYRSASKSLGGLTRATIRSQSVLGSTVVSASANAAAASACAARRDDNSSSRAGSAEMMAAPRAIRMITAKLAPPVTRRSSQQQEPDRRGVSGVPSDGNKPDELAGAGLGVVSNQQNRGGGVRDAGHV